MKIKVLSIFLLLLIGSFLAWKLLSPVPDVVGLPYSDARAKIINAGWEPLPAEYLKPGWQAVGDVYNEMRFCVDDDAVEAHLCVFGFRRSKIQCLRIVTAGAVVSAFRVVQVGRECAN